MVSHCSYLGLMDIRKGEYAKNRKRDSFDKTRIERNLSIPKLQSKNLSICQGEMHLSGRQRCSRSSANYSQTRLVALLFSL